MIPTPSIAPGASHAQIVSGAVTGVCWLITSRYLPRASTSAPCQTLVKIVEITGAEIPRLDEYLASDAHSGTAASPGRWSCRAPGGLLLPQRSLSGALWIVGFAERSVEFSGHSARIVTAGLYGAENRSAGRKAAISSVVHEMRLRRFLQV